ncbi:MAG: periplasmic protein TonB [Methylobacteriaceae bacterium]|jgi:TonB family protein|nr:periplasmic protein TonB [Methylobacteriaceae bacterium]
MSRRNALAIWIPAAIGAVALHLACVGLVYANLPQEDADDLGVPAFEVGLDLLSPRIEATDLPPGPESEASAAAPAQIEQKEKVEETALPQEKPTEAEEPDRIVAETAPKTPMDEEQKVAAVDTNASTESAASEATAPAPIENAREAPVATAPAAGIGSTGQEMSKKWKSLLSAHLNRFKRYPVKSARRNAEVQVSFTLDRRGHLKVASVLRGSGDPAFDQAALAMLRRADPLPPPPTAVTDDELSFTVPIVYRLKGKR